MRVSNRMEFPIAFLASLAIGAVPVPTSAQLTPIEIAKIVEDLSPKAILHSPDLPLPSLAPKRIDVSNLQVHLSLPPAEFHMGDPDRLGYIVYTSGTSGRPMAVMHAHRAIWARQMMIRDWYDLRSSDRLLHAGAFNWTFTLGTGLMDPWSVGATSIIPSQSDEIHTLQTTLQENDVTLFAAAPGVYRKLLKHHNRLDLPNLRHGICAGEKLTDDLRYRWQDATGTDLHEAFGMSECSTFISGSPHAPARPGTLGRPQPGRRVAIINAKGIAPNDTPGTIAIHKSDPGLMLGYFNAQEATDARFQGEWFLTGDTGQMDGDGNITYLGRSDDMMNAGGFRVSPIEVEAALAQCPGLTQIAVTEVTVKADVRVIAAFYTSDTGLTPQALESFANLSLARYKQPRIFNPMDSLPTNANGKLSRKTLREQFEARHERDNQT